jgi:hypothetical protein
MYTKIYIPIHYDTFLDGLKARHEEDSSLPYLINGKYWL